MPMTTKPTHAADGHRGRLREKFLATGLTGFHDYEVIELLLTLATPRKDCKDAAKAALVRFNSLQEVLEAPAADLCAVDGIGPKNMLGIKLIKAVAERYLKAKVIDQPIISNPQTLCDYLTLHFSRQSRECFCVVFLNAKNRVLETETLFVGTLTASSVYPREVVRAALARQAAALVFAHNHPSGDPSPSPDDVAITRKLIAACRLVGVAVHDHIIVGQGRHFSFADHGYIRQLTDDIDTTQPARRK